MGLQGRENDGISEYKYCVFFIDKEKVICYLVWVIYYIKETKMNIKDVITNEKVDFTGVELSYFLIGLLSAFENRFQAVADSEMEEISWMQFFAVVCIDLCKEKPTVKELAEIMGSSHQNVKQILLKLEKKGFVNITVDEKDKRKQRIELTDYCREFCARNDEMTAKVMGKMFEGVSDEQLQITIQTIIQIEENLKNLVDKKLRM